MPCLRASIRLGISLCGIAWAEVEVSHSTRSLSGGWTEHVYAVVQTSGPGAIKDITFGPLFADGSAMTSRGGTSYPVLSAPAGWIPYQGYFEESDTTWFGFEALPENPGLAAGGAALFKVYTPDERFQGEAEFECFATVILSNYRGMTRKGRRLPSARPLVFSQDFTSPNRGYDRTSAAKPEAWGFSGAHWKVHGMKAGLPDPGTASASIETEYFEPPATAPGAALDYSLQSPVFPRPLAYAPGKSGLLARFALEFQDGWSILDRFSLCLEDSRKGERIGCLRVLPQRRKSGRRFSRQVSFDAPSVLGAIATVKPGENAPKEEELPEGEDPHATGWWVFQIEFATTGDVRVLVRPDPLEKFQNVLSFRYRKAFRFDRLVATYRTGWGTDSHHNISLDDFLVIPTTP